MNCEITENTNGMKIFHSRNPFHFVLEGQLPELQLAFETYGKLNVARDNAIVVHHALSTNSHISSSEQNPTKGWWELMVGPKRPIDTEKYFVICINNLGSCFGSSGPTSINPLTQHAYQTLFPVVTIADMVRSQFLLLDFLGIKKLHAVIGASMGAMLSLTAAVLFPERVERLISISSCYRSYPTTAAFRAIQREIIRLDPAWHNGFYEHNPQRGFLLARKLGQLTYRNYWELNKRFITAPLGENIHDYLNYNAGKFIIQFDANSYLYLTQAMDDFDITHGYHEPLEPFQKILAHALVIGVDSDTLFIPQQQQELYDMLKSANVAADYIHHESTYGHDAFLVETETMGIPIKKFLAA